MKFLNMENTFNLKDLEERIKMIEERNYRFSKLYG